MRNRGNLQTTIVGAPALAALIGTVLRYNGSGIYDFASAYHIPTYLFLALIVAMFLGLTNSADDIIRDRVVLQRERNLNIRLPYYIFAKTITLAIFAAIQCMLFVLIGNAILEVRGMFWAYFLFSFITACTGICLGLLISSLVADGKTAVNIVPLILIPNIILGGALIKYEDMNRDLDFRYTVQRWFSTHPDSAKESSESSLQVPLICEFMPSRWAYEAMIVAQAKLNPLTSRQEHVQREIDDLVALSQLTQAQSQRLDDLKDTLALLSGLESNTAREVDKGLKRIDRIIAGAPLDPMAPDPKKTGVSAERIYVNQKITDLVSKAETEQADYRRQKHINVFFGPEKYIGRTHFSVLAVNTAVLLLFSLGALLMLHESLRRQLRTKT
jgi:hypothetical protein